MGREWPSDLSHEREITVRQAHNIWRRIATHDVTDPVTARAVVHVVRIPWFVYHGKRTHH